MTEFYPEDQEKIEEFLDYLDLSGYNFHVLAGIRSLLRQPTGRKYEFREKEEIDPNDENTGELILAG